MYIYIYIYLEEGADGDAVDGDAYEAVEDAHDLCIIYIYIYIYREREI